MVINGCNLGKSLHRRLHQCKIECFGFLLRAGYNLIVYNIRFDSRIGIIRIIPGKNLCIILLVSSSRKVDTDLIIRQNLMILNLRCQIFAGIFILFSRRNPSGFDLNF